MLEAKERRAAAATVRAFIRRSGSFILRVRGKILNGALFRLCMSRVRDTAYTMRVSRPAACSQAHNLKLARSWLSSRLGPWSRAALLRQARDSRPSSSGGRPGPGPGDLQVSPPSANASLI